MNLVIYVFSFNRGRFLENCLSSIARMAGGFNVIIVDDNSTDRDTAEILKKLSYKYEVIRGDRPKETEFKTGGLSGCMNIAMDHARSRGYEYALFIQDDMQLVRGVRDFDAVWIARYFETVKNSIQISSSFVRRLSADTLLRDYEVDESSGAYLRKREAERGKSNFSDTGIFCIRRFHDMFGNFDVGEGKNSMKARALGLTCGRAIYPFMCWLPYPMSYRGRRRGVRHLLFESLGRSGFYPIEPMTDQAVDDFLRRDPCIPPIMEDFLVAPDAPRSDIWSTGGGEYNFVAYDSRLARIYMRLRQLKKAALVIARRS